MFAALSKIVFDLMKLPAEAPEPPRGDYQSVQVFRASPRWLQYRFVLYWIGAGVLAFVSFALAIASLVTAQIWAGAIVVLVAIALAALMAIAWFCVRIEYDLRTYIVTDRSLRVREGAWIFKEMTLTYANVQNVQVMQGPLQRLFRIEDLRVDTAGGGGTGKGEGHGTSGHSVTLAGLENAREVRDLVLSYVKNQTRGSGLGDLDDPEHARSSSRGIRGSPEVLSALEDLRASASGLRRAAESRARAG